MKLVGKSVKTTLGFVAALSLLSALLLAAITGSAEQRRDELECWWNIQEEIPQPYGMKGDMEIRVNVSITANIARCYDSKKTRMMIFNMDTNRFWIVSYKDKTFSEGTMEELNRLVADRRKTEENDLRAVEDGLKKFDGDKLNTRKAYIENEKSLLRLSEARLTAKVVSGAPVEVEGRKAQIVEVFYEGKKMGSVWVSTDVVAPDRWKNFVSIMSAIEPVRWKIIEAAGGVPLQMEAEFFGARLSWKFFRASNGPVSIGNFFLPNEYNMVNPSLD